MSTPIPAFLLHTFVGERYKDHGLDVDVLSELLAFKMLLVETAKEIWRQTNPDRQRLPSGFEDSLTLKIYQVLAGSTTIPLVRPFAAVPDQLPFLPAPDELDDARDLVLEAIDAAGRDALLPPRFPRKLLACFANYGKTLREDESYRISRPADDSPRHALYTRQVRERLIYRLEGDYEDLIDLAGEARSADLDGCQFTLRLPDDTKVPGKFTAAQESVIMEALREHASMRLRVKGRALFNAADGKLKRILEVTDLTVQQSGEATYDPNAQPIWEIALEIGAAVPAEEWAAVPSDLSKNLDYHRYGTPRDEK
jgi:hypothetical protein